MRVFVEVNGLRAKVQYQYFDDWGFFGNEVSLTKERMMSLESSAKHWARGFLVEDEVR